ncbi:MAG: DUF305 domain-containing protein [Mycobacterium sp.]
MKSLACLLAALATALLLSSCTSPAGTSGDGHADHEHGSQSSTAAAHAQSNAADVAFATDMIPHHQQAVAMAALVPDRSTDPAVIKLASEISAAQGPEIETMKAFLVQWSAGEDASHEGHGGAMEGMQMPGMVDDVTMTKLASLNGVEFDRLFLQSMIGHHEGAISMANTEIADGVNADAKALAKQIVTAQQAEIGQMKQMLGE